MTKGLPKSIIDKTDTFYKLRVHNGLVNYVYNYFASYLAAVDVANALKDIGICTSYSIEHADKEEIPVTDEYYA